MNSGSHVQYGRRPVLVISSNEVNDQLKVVTVCAITSKKKSTAKGAILFLETGDPLPKPSYALLFQVFTIDNQKLQGCVGTISDQKFDELNSKLRFAWDLDQLFVLITKILQ
jgi:mRNA-degrading endonuclease toxin of MazEF toxin-antitoxin module